MNLAAGIIDNVAELVGKLPQIFEEIKSTFAGFDFLQIGIDVVKGIASGITNGIGEVAQAATNLANSIGNKIKEALQIASPSKLMRKYGQYTAEGLALGITDGQSMVDSAMGSLMQSSIGDIMASNANLTTSVSPAGVGGFNQTVIVNSPTQLDPSEVARQTANSTRQYALAMRR
ncbi:MAG: hypothetical protein HUJ93_09160, partial [Bacteroidales bacterium]|nr:hypothetical protein [Bacteroidales bacterium]